MSEEQAGVTVVNFSHPITAEQRAQIEALAGKAVIDILDVDAQLDLRKSMRVQVRQMIEATGLNATQWQSLPLVVVLPAMSSSSALLLAEIQGRSGFLPTIAILRRGGGSVPVFDVVELLELQEVRDEARATRGSSTSADLQTGETRRTL